MKGYIVLSENGVMTGSISNGIKLKENLIYKHTPEKKDGVEATVFFSKEVAEKVAAATLNPETAKIVAIDYPRFLSEKKDKEELDGQVQANLDK